MGTVKRIFIFSFLLIICLFYSVVAQSNCEQINLPDGGSVGAICENLNGDLFVSTKAGLYKSVDEGSQWNLVNNEEGLCYINRFLVHSSGKIFCTTGFRYFVLSSSGEVLLKEQIYTFKTFAEYENGKVLAVDLSNKVMVSSDTGKTWQQIAVLKDGYLLESIFVNKAGTIFIASGKNIYSSFDNGKTWNAQNIVFPGDVFFAESSDGSVYMFGTFVSYKTLDSGKTWSEIFDLPSQSITSAWITPDDIIYISTPYSGAFMFNKKDWIGLGNANPHFYLNAILVSKNNKVYVATTTKGVCLYDSKNKLWIEKSSGLEANIYSFIVTPRKSLLLFTGSYLFRSADDGNSWEKVFDSNNYYLTKLFVLEGSNSIFLVFNRQILRSDDDGLTWAVVDSTLPKGYISDINISGNNTIYLSDGVTLSRSSDWGKNWVPIWKCDSSCLDCINDQVSYIAVSKNEISFTFNRNVYRSFDQGNSWIQINASALPQRRLGDGIYNYFLRRSPLGNLFMVVGNSIYSQSANYFWEKIYDGGLTNNVPTRIGDLTFRANGEMFFSIYNQIWHSVDAGKSWQFIVEGDKLFYAQLSVSDDYVYATNGNYLFKIYGPTLTTSKFSTVYISNSYPNPFNNQTTIEFYIQQPGYVNLSIFNSIGQKVETVVQNYTGAGFYKINWQPKNLASGIYLYHLQTSKFTETKKMIYLK